MVDEKPMGEARFEMLSLDSLRTSSLNPRKKIEGVALDELIESIRKVGVLTPLLVRPVNEHYEIAAGHRRFTAAARAGLGSVPAIVRPMGDVQFLEVLTIENLQREDLHPLDEALGYRTLMEKAGYDVPAIAAKVGKSESYVYQRLKLADLIPEAEQPFWDGQITAGHAILIARLQPKDQQEIITWCFDNHWRGVPSVRELSSEIDRTIHLDLHAAAFKKDDPILVSAAGSCKECPKRTGYLPQLFLDIAKKDTCTDRRCYEGKVRAFIEIEARKLGEDSDVPILRLSSEYQYQTGKPKKDGGLGKELYTVIEKKKEACPSARPGILVDGREGGKVLTVCTDPKCKIHGRGSASRSGDESWKKQRKAEREKKRIETGIRMRILEATLAAWPGQFSEEDWRFVVVQFFQELWEEYRKRLFARHALVPVKSEYSKDYNKPMQDWVQKASAMDCARIVLEMCLLRNVERAYESGKMDPLLEIAEWYGVDCKSIEAEARAAIKTKKEKSVKKAVNKAAQTSAKKK